MKTFLSEKLTSTRFGHKEGFAPFRKSAVQALTPSFSPPEGLGLAETGSSPPDPSKTRPLAPVTCRGTARRPERGIRSAGGAAACPKPSRVGQASGSRSAERSPARPGPLRPGSAPPGDGGPPRRPARPGAASTRGLASGRPGARHRPLPPRGRPRGPRRRSAGSKHGGRGPFKPGRAGAAAAARCPHLQSVPF